MPSPSESNEYMPHRIPMSAGIAVYQRRFCSRIQATSLVDSVNDAMSIPDRKASQESGCEKSDGEFPFRELGCLCCQLGAQVGKGTNMFFHIPTFLTVEAGELAAE
jgi:hypothetical protein